MTDKELIKALRHCAGFVPECDECPLDSNYNCIDDAKITAADRLEALLAENEHLREVTKMMPQWVSVSERLPENSDKQVLAVVSGFYDGMYFHDALEIAEFPWDEGWILEAYPEWENPNVTYWRELPEPPSTEGVE